MAIPSLLDSYIDETYQRLVQTVGGTEFADGLGNPITFGTTNTGSLLLTASVSLNTIEFTKGDNTKFSITVDTGSGGSISGDYVTTSSFNAFTSSVVTTASFNSFTQSYNTGSFTGSFTGRLTGTASFATSASQAVSASYASNGGVTQLLAGSNITLSPTNGLGQVTINSTGGGGGNFNTATGSYGSFYSTQTQTNVAGTARSMSLNVTDITNGVSISGSTNPFNTYIKTQNAGVYNIQFSAQVDKTDSGTDEIWIWIRKNNTDLSDTATSIQLVGNGAHYVAAWNFFVNAAANDYFQLMWYSPDANVRLHAEPAFGVVPGIPSLIVTANRVDQFLSNTGSFSGSFTGNLVGTATTASHAVNFTIESTLTIDQTLTDYHVTVADAPTTWGIFERATGSYTAAIGKYTIYSGTNARAGEFMTVWNGTTVNFTDVATTDIGSTANLTLQSSLSGGNIRIDAVAASSGPWTIKMLVTYL
jgi:hypothetical protein